LFVTNSTVSLNVSDTSGGGIFSMGSTALFSSTIVFNEADGDHDEQGGTGGGVFTGDTTRPFELHDTVVAGNVSAAINDDDCDGLFSLYGQVRFGELGTVRNGCTFTGPGPGYYDFLGSLAELGPLQSNGGSTQTHAVLAPSVLIDGTVGSSGCLDRFGSSLATDQRDAPRIAGARCDIGAFEYGALPAGSLFSDGFELGNFWAWGG
jgi:hypothetical protein